jgi:acetyltransferase-like isoleucine patch superfamily enzyme
MARISLILEYVVSTIRIRLIPQVELQGKKLVDIRGQIKCSKGSKVILHDKVGMRKGSYLYVRKGGIVEIGERTTFNHNCLITARKSITIGKRSIFGPGVMIYDHDHDYKTDMQEYRCEDVSIGGNCWIGANSIILKGVHLGDNCVVAAGTILRGGDYPSNSLIYNSCSTVIKQIQGQFENEKK